MTDRISKPQRITRTASAAAGDIPTLTLLALDPAIIQHILSFLPLLDLLHTSQSCKTLRVLATDPLLHKRRLRSVRPALSSALAQRPDRVELLARRTPLVSIHPEQPAMYINGASQAAQIQAYISLSRSLTSHRLRRAVERRAPLSQLAQAGLLDFELEKKTLSPSLVPAMRALKKAIRSDSLRRGMRAEDDNSWKTPARVIDGRRGVWREDDPRVVSAMCPSVRSSIKFWEGLQASSQPP